MSKLVPIGLGAAAVIAVLFLGSRFIGSPTSNVGGPTSQPPASVAPSEAPSEAASEAPSESPSPSPIAPPPLSEVYTSDRYGLSISYPAGWVTRPATEPWASGIPDYGRPDGDVISHPTLEGNLWIVVASQPLAGKSGEQWADDMFAELVREDFCNSTLTDAIEIDGAQGMLCDRSAAAVTAGDRGYLLMLYVSNDDPSVGVTYDRAWFEAVLATVQLRPEDAVDAAPSATP